MCIVAGALWCKSDRDVHACSKLRVRILTHAASERQDLLTDAADQMCLIHHATRTARCRSVKAHRSKFRKALPSFTPGHKCCVLQRAALVDLSDASGTVVIACTRSPARLDAVAASVVTARTADKSISAYLSLAPRTVTRLNSTPCMAQLSFTTSCTNTSTSEKNSRFSSLLATPKHQYYPPLDFVARNSKRARPAHLKDLKTERLPIDSGSAISRERERRHTGRSLSPVETHSFVACAEMTKLT